MTLITGAQFVRSLKDGRRVFCRGRRIDDVTAHPGFRGCVDLLAGLYDLQNDSRYRDEMSVDWEGERVPYAYFPPPRRATIWPPSGAAWRFGRADVGQMGRFPGMLAEFTVGLRDAAAWLGEKDARYAQNARNYHRHCAVNDLALTHALNDQYHDRSKTLGEQPNPNLVLRVVRETPDGPIVRGVRNLATQAAVSHEVLVHPNAPRRNDEADFAIAFASPINAPGLSVICRDPYGEHAARDRLPLSARFDEVDCTLIFDDVLVPWERVFAYRDPELLSQYHRSIAAFAGYFELVRQLIRMKSFVAVAGALTKWSGRDKEPATQARLGQIIQDTEILRACIVAAEAAGRVTPGGHWLAAVSPAFRLHSIDAFARAEQAIKDLLTSSLIVTVGAKERQSESIGTLMSRYFDAPNVDADERLRMTALAADMVLSHLGGRTQLYERLAGGEPDAIRRRLSASYDFDAIGGHVYEFLARERE